ncbi:hypothetical protein RJT34_14416 [Clitoria ternatea]|uniref:Uncharacterized protein n=1 Tax=Clitoria ternatea TaxID=43366 RepID=A0AAN9JSL2_CLITE
MKLNRRGKPLSLSLNYLLLHTPISTDPVPLSVLLHHYFPTIPAGGCFVSVAREDDGVGGCSTSNSAAEAHLEEEGMILRQNVIQFDQFINLWIGWNLESNMSSNPIKMQFEFD